MVEHKFVILGVSGSSLAVAAGSTKATLGFVDVPFGFADSGEGVGAAGVGLSFSLLMLDADRLLECRNLSINDFLFAFAVALGDAIWVEICQHVDIQYREEFGWNGCPDWTRNLIAY
jgi:hypothetical protein